MCNLHRGGGDRGQALLVQQLDRAGRADRLAVDDHCPANRDNLHLDPDYQHPAEHSAAHNRDRPDHHGYHSVPEGRYSFSQNHNFFSWRFTPTLQVLTTLTGSTIDTSQVATMTLPANLKLLLKSKRLCRGAGRTGQRPSGPWGLLYRFL